MKEEKEKKEKREKKGKKKVNGARGAARLHGGKRRGGRDAYVAHVMRHMVAL